MPDPRTFGRAINRRQADDFAKLRSRFVDIFSSAELRLAKLCLKLGLKKTENSSTGQRIKELGLLRPSSQLSKASASKIRSICSDFDRLMKIRNSVVHATMSIGQKEQEDVAFFQKASDAAIDHPLFFVMSFDDFAWAIETISSLTDKLDELLTPPSSPPQP